MMKTLWTIFCFFAGAAILGIGTWLLFNSVALSVIGAIIGAAIGTLFSKYISLFDFLMHS